MSSGITLLDDDGPELAGVQVAAWASQSATAQLLGITPRQVRELEGLGLPCEGRGGEGRDGRQLAYPLPHVVAWMRAYRDLTARREVVLRLEIEAAFEIHQSMAAEEEARGSGAIQTRAARR